MKIKKVSGTAVLKGNVVDNLTDNSTENAPSQRAVNEALLDKYSTNEIKTNKIWIDGKPIYRKTIFVPSLPNNEDAREYSHNIKNMNMGWFDPTGCFAIWPTGVINPFPYMNYTGASLFLHDVTKDSFKIKTTQDRSGLSAYVTILYTKTTD